MHVIVGIDVESSTFNYVVFGDGSIIDDVDMLADRSSAEHYGLIAAMQYIEDAIKIEEETEKENEKETWLYSR